MSGLRLLVFAVDALGRQPQAGTTWRAQLIIQARHGTGPSGASTSTPTSCASDSKRSTFSRMQVDAWSPPTVLLTVDLVILTLRESRLHILLVERGEDPFRGMLALPGGFLSHDGEEILDAAHRELGEETALTSGCVHLEQLAVYGDSGRDPRGRVVSVAHLAIAPELPDPVAGTDARDAAWIPAEAVLSGETPLAFDHHRIAEDGIERARTKIEFSALATAFCGESFTIAELQQVYEAVWGTTLDTRNFYRKVQAAKGFIVPAGTDRRTTGGRPARLYRAGPRTVLFPPLIRPAPSATEENTREEEE